MGFLRTLGRALALWGRENALDLLTVVVLPGTGKAATRALGPRPARWAATNRRAAETVLGAYETDADD